MATGIYFGGPGAIFWLWVLAFFGTTVAQVETTLSQTYKRVVDGEYRGGPAYYMEGGIRNRKFGKVLGCAYAVITILSVTALMAYYFYTESNTKFLFGENRFAVRCVQVIFIASVFLGTILTAQAIWTLGDIGNALMAWLNVFALLILGNQGVRIYQNYEKQKAGGIEEPEFHPENMELGRAGDTWGKTRK